VPLPDLLHRKSTFAERAIATPSLTMLELAAANAGHLTTT
jgi:hypothetical protein